MNFELILYIASSLTANWIGQPTLWLNDSYTVMSSLVDIWGVLEEEGLSALTL